MVKDIVLKIISLLKISKMAVISKEEFLRACNEKIKRETNLADEERRRREEEERIRIAEEERRRREKEWDAWYSTLPSNCKSGFEFNGFRYSVNPTTRSITKTPLNNDIRVLTDDRNLDSTSINNQLGIK